MNSNTSKAEEIKFEETNHDLIISVHCWKIVSDIRLVPKFFDALFMTGLAPTTWKIAQLIDVLN